MAVQKLSLVDKITSLRVMGEEDQNFSGLDKHIASAELLLKKSINTLTNGFNPAAYMVAYSVLTAFLPLTNCQQNHSDFFGGYSYEFRKMVEFSARFKNDIEKLNPYFLFDGEILKSLPTEKQEKPKITERGTRTFDAIKDRIAKIQFSDSPKDIREKPKFYDRFKLTENGLPERFKEALILRSKQELYKFKTTNGEVNYLRSYSLIFLVMPLLGLIEDSLVDEWIKIKTNKER